MKNKLLAVAIAFVGLFSFMAAPAYAADTSTTDAAGTSTTDICNNSNIAKEIKVSYGCDTSTAKLEDVVQGIINGVLGVLGIVAVVFIIIGGVNYMTSAGDAGKTQKARNTILYAAIGLVVCAFAAVIVNFTINIINNKAAPSTSKDAPATVPAENNKQDKK